MAVTKLSNSGIKTGVLKYDSMLAGNPAYQPFVSQLAYDSIASTTLSSTSNTITFSGISQTYAHLELRIFNKVTRSGTSDNLYLNVNGDTGNNYAMTSVARTYGASPAVAYNTGADQYIVFPDALPAGNQTDIFGYAVIRLTDYTKTKWKAVDGYWGWCTAFAQAGFANVNGRVGYTTAAWKNTSAITSITITTSAPTFQTGCIFALYGIKSGY